MTIENELYSVAKKVQNSNPILIRVANEILWKILEIVVLKIVGNNKENVVKYIFKENTGSINNKNGCK
jgi:hypothetical protein